MGESRGLSEITVLMMSPEHLVDWIQSGMKFLLIDCRSYMEYHTSHIQSAVNIGGNRMVRRRLLQNKVTVAELLERLSHTSPLESNHPLVVYEQCVDNPASLCPENFAYLVLNQLMRTHRDVRLLRGGYLAFQSRFPSFCWENTDKLPDEDFVDSVVEQQQQPLSSSASSSSSPRGSDRYSAVLVGGETRAAVSSTLSPTLPPSAAALPSSSATPFDKSGGYRSLPPDVTMSGTGTIHWPLPNPEIPLPTPSPLSPSTRWHSLSGPALPVSNLGPTPILPHLLLGSQQDAMSPQAIRSHGITHVINVSVDGPVCPYVPPDRFLRVPVHDNYSDKMAPHFQQAFRFLTAARESRGRVLIHCSAGISRSPTLAIAYLMQTNRMTMRDAYDLVKSRRSTVSPNFNFLGQLIEFERQLQPQAQTQLPQQPAGPSQSSGKKRDRPSRLLFSTSSSLPRSRDEESPGDPQQQRDTQLLQPPTEGKRSRVSGPGPISTADPFLPSPSTHFSRLDISSPTEAVACPLPRMMDLLSGYPTLTSLDELHFEPCQTTKTRLRRWVTTAAADGHHQPGTITTAQPELGVRKSASSTVLLLPRPAVLPHPPLQQQVEDPPPPPSSTTGLAIAELMIHRRARSYESLSPCSPNLLASDEQQPGGPHVQWPTALLNLSEASCRQQVECHQSTSSLSSNNSHNSNNHSNFGVVS